jgi:hypothetical protein
MAPQFGFFVSLKRLFPDSHAELRSDADASIGKPGVPFARKSAGHASSKYIWRIVQPSDEEKESALSDLFSPRLRQAATFPQRYAGN